MHSEAHLKALSLKHSNLERNILDEELRPAPDSILLHDLKKEKLRLKDEIEHFKQMS